MYTHRCIHTHTNTYMYTLIHTHTKTDTFCRSLVTKQTQIPVPIVSSKTIKWAFSLLVPSNKCNCNEEKLSLQSQGERLPLPPNYTHIRSTFFFPSVVLSFRIHRMEEMPHVINWTQNGHCTTRAQMLHATNCKQNSHNTMHVRVHQHISSSIIQWVLFVAIVCSRWVDQWKNANNLAVLHAIDVRLTLIDCAWKCACYT